MRPAKRSLYAGLAGVGIMLGAGSVATVGAQGGGRTAATAMAAASALSDQNIQRELANEGSDGSEVGSVLVEVDTTTGVVDVRFEVRPGRTPDVRR